ncbi:deoxyribonuclease II activity protein [Paramecium bursaria]
MILKIMLLILIGLGNCKDCLDEEGNNVDYWFILKLPSKKILGLSGWEYLYCDAEDQCKELRSMKDKIGDITSPLSRTVAQIKFDGNEDEMSIIWTDQPFPKFASSNKAHSKGIMTASASTKDGFIINHSLPNFPVYEEYPPKNKKILPGMPKSGRFYAQHFFCVSLTIDQIEKIAYQYKIAQIIIHLSQIPTKDFEYPQILSLLSNGKFQQDLETPTEAKSGKAEIQSKGGLQILVYSIKQGKKKITGPIISEETEIDDTFISRKRAHPDHKSESSEVEENLSKKKKLKPPKKLTINQKNHKQQKPNHFFLEIDSYMQDPDDIIMDESSSESSEEEEIVQKNGFFADIVAAGLHQNIAMSTWGKGAPRLQDPVCGTSFKSISAQERLHQITVNDLTFNYLFSYTKEHSKIGITFPNENINLKGEKESDENFKKWIIVADLNRQVLQVSRGGTALCFQNDNLWEILNKSLQNRQKC